MEIGYELPQVEIEETKKVTSEPLYQGLQGCAPE